MFKKLIISILAVALIGFVGLQDMGGGDFRIGDKIIMHDDGPIVDIRLVAEPGLPLELDESIVLPHTTTA